MRYAGRTMLHICGVRDGGNNAAVAFGNVAENHVLFVLHSSGYRKQNIASRSGNGDNFASLVWLTLDGLHDHRVNRDANLVRLALSLFRPQGEGDGRVTRYARVHFPKQDLREYEIQIQALTSF